MTDFQNKFFCLCFLLFASFGAWGQEKKYAFSLSQDINILYGTSFEKLYIIPGSDRMVSELQWNMKPLLFLGAGLEFGPRNPFSGSAFYIGLDFKTGLPWTSTIEDRDWLVPTTTPGSLSLFSSHDNYIEFAMLAELESGFSTPLSGHTVFRLFGAVEYMGYKFEAHDGYIQYGTNNHDPNNANPYTPWNPAWPREAISGKGIVYRQHWIIFKPGIAFDFRAGKFDFSFSLAVSPFILCYTADDHLKRIPAFRVDSELKGGLFVEPKIEFAFNPTAKYSIEIRAGYKYINNTRGDLTQSEYYGNGTVTTRISDISGAEFEAFYCGLFSTLKF